MHVRRTARDAFFASRAEDVFFTSRGDVVLEDAPAARRFAARLHERALENPTFAGLATASAAELLALSLFHELAHAVVSVHRERHPQSFASLLERLDASVGNGATDTLSSFLELFPPPELYHALRGDAPEDAPSTGRELLARGGVEVRTETTEELLLLWLTAQNRAYDPVRPLVSDAGLGPSYAQVIDETTRFFETEPSVSPGGESLVDLLLAPIRHAPGSIFDQLAFVEQHWGRSLGLRKLALLRRILTARDARTEEDRWFARRGAGPGPGEPLMDAMRFDARRGEASEPKRFSEDKEWMPRVVLLAKSVYVWLDQLSRRYGRDVSRLDQIPDEELDTLARRGFSSLWLIGLFERSEASRRIKQMRGDESAMASAYSLGSYRIAPELGGEGAWQNLRDRAWARGIRLAADMVPNHVGLDGDWVLHHPDWFLQAPYPPYPAYRFGGPDLSRDPSVGVFLEEGYWNQTDAAVVFRRHDRRTGHDRFIYHGNDGTSMPWNDTAQLDYSKAEVRRAVIETILHVASMFPVIRFDAAMTLAKKHYQRLWFPLPGHGGGAIPSRSDFSMTQEQFDEVFPVEFWREVVDTVAVRAPNTLLLAEAFWMMEGYFVRSLGMHRVYNSAFMNMLKREENAKYRETIKNVLDFEPRILERFVNFMNNPDEDTAVAQFGDGDKYFGTCVIMSTLPGLPMFGHGQVEGFREKYGMEFRRAKWNETPDEALVARHEREIFPLLQKRWLFAGVAQFALYDFVTDGGWVDEDVYAYSNAAGEHRALVLFHNKFKNTVGSVRWSTPVRRDDGALATVQLHEALGIGGLGGFVVFRDEIAGLEYLRPTVDLVTMGLTWALRAFEYAVFTGFHVVHATATRPYDKLAEELGGRGVPSVEEAVLAVHHRPVHQPLAIALSQGHVAWLTKGWDEASQAPTPEALSAFEERLTQLADGIAYVTERTVPRTDAFERAKHRYLTALRLLHGATPYAEEPAPVSSPVPVPVPVPVPASPSVSESVPATVSETEPVSVTEPEPVAASETESVPVSLSAAAPLDAPSLLALVHLEACLDLLSLADGAPDGVLDEERERLVSTWDLARPVLAAFPRERAALLLVAITLPEGPVRDGLARALGDPRGRVFLDVHDHDGITWLSKERLDDLVRLLGEREALAERMSLAMARRAAEEASALAERTGYRVAPLSDELDALRFVTKPFV